MWIEPWVIGGRLFGRTYREDRGVAARLWKVYYLSNGGTPINKYGFVRMYGRYKTLRIRTFAQIHTNRL